MNQPKGFRVLHFVTDDKFIPLVQTLYEEAFPGCNQYRCLTKTPGQYKFLQPGPTLVAVDENYFQSEALQADYANSDCVLVHSMLSAFASGVRRVPHDKLVVWSGWGFDYYNILEPQIGEIVLPQTAQACRMIVLRHRVASLFKARKVMQKLVALASRQPRSRVQSPNQDSLQSIASRIDIFSANPSEERMIRLALPDLKGRFQILPYYTTEDTLEKGPGLMSGPDVLVGNSATPENNHLEAFSLLKKADLSGRRIVVPLSYGRADYGDHICEVGNRLFGDKFTALRQFLSLSDYNQRLESCGVVLMNHVRQQAVGNINAALYKGAKVFLRKQNPLFRFYQEIGASFFSVDDLQRELSDISYSSTQTSLYERNRKVIGEFWSRKNALAGIHSLHAFYLEKRSQRLA